MLARLRAGDDRALGALYDQYGSLVHGIAVQLVGARLESAGPGTKVAVEYYQNYDAGWHWTLPASYCTTSGCTHVPPTAVPMTRLRTRSAGSQPMAPATSSRPTAVSSRLTTSRSVIGKATSVSTS